MSRSFIEGFNYYVPAMTCGADLGQNLNQRVNFGAPAVADADAIVAAMDGDAAVAETAVDVEATGTFGRNVTIAASAAVGAGTTLTVTIKGRDYLGQPITETIATAHADTTDTIQGVKAFKHVDSYAGDGGADDAVTCTIGFGSKLGLPYKTIGVVRELEDDVLANAGTLTAPVLTDPQTAITGDPRGLYTPTGTLDGSAVFEVDCVFSNFVNSDGNGGLYGIQHYNG